MKKIITILGARPQFIKAATVSRIFKNDFRNKFNEVIVHTGQHYDENMSKVFFTELDIPEPKYNLQISGGGHGAMTGLMLIEIEKILLVEKPDLVLVYGDTNSTLAGALAAVKLHIPIAHVEAGLRSFNKCMPEEINRVLTDNASTLLFCPTDTSVLNLTNAGITSDVYHVGDVMYDSSLYYKSIANDKSKILQKYSLNEFDYVLATCHRAENTDNIHNLRRIFQGLIQVSFHMPVIIPLHPRTRKILLSELSELDISNLTITDPLSFIDMTKIEQSSFAIITDSGGVQKESYFFQRPCITFRNETEWVETVISGWNTLTGADSNKIYQAFLNLQIPHEYPLFYGDGNAAKKVAFHIDEHFEQQI